MDVRQIRYFTHVANLRSFSKAAQCLNVAQPALSRQIQSLEQELQTQLLFRTTRGVEPTEAGLVFLRLGEKILLSVEELREAVVNASEHPAGDVSLGLPPSLSAVFAPCLMEEAGRLYPDVRFRIIEGLSVFLEEWLALGRIDLAVLTKLGEMGSLTRVNLATEEMVLVAPAGLLNPGQQSIPLRDVARLQLTITRGFRNVIDYGIRDLGIALTYATEYDSIPIIKGLLAKGECVTILPWGLVQQELFARQFAVLSIVEPRLTRDLVLAANPRRPGTAATRAIRNLVLKRTRHLPLQPHSGVGIQGDTGWACGLCRISTWPCAPCPTSLNAERRPRRSGSTLAPLASGSA